MRALSLFVSAVFLLLGCASEDPNIVNPQPGSRRIVLRLFNMIPDGASRKLVLEQGFQSMEVGTFRFSDTVRSPGDSSFLEIVKAGVTEFKSFQRERFAQNSVYNVFTLASVGAPSVFDTVLIANANAALTTVPVAQVRVVQLIPDTSRFFDVRIGCANGLPLTSSPILFGRASLYSQVYPGLAVFSITATKDGVTEVLGTYQTVLGERKVYSIILYRDATSDDVLIMFIEEGDLSPQAEREFIPVSQQAADVRVLNLASSNVDVSLRNTGQSLVKGLATSNVGAIEAVPACQSELADVFEATYSSGVTAVDSASLTVRGKFTVITTDSGGKGHVVMTPTIQRPFGSVGKAVVRVVNASAVSKTVVVSLGARSDATAANGIAAGFTIARDIVFDSLSAPVALAPGLLPLTVTTSTTPTNIIDVTRAIVEADKNYDLVVYDNGTTIQTLLLEEEQSSQTLQPLLDGAFIRVLNGSSRLASVPIQIGLVIPSGSLFYGNSLATTVPIGNVPYSINGIAGDIATRLDERTLVIYAEGGGSPNVIQLTNPPLIPTAGSTSRRVVNATEDIRLVSVSIDSVPKIRGEGEHLAKDVAYGTSSDVVVSQQDRRGTYFAYNSETGEILYSFPVQLAPLGNNYTFVVVGRKDGTYEVIVSQEF